MNRFHAVAVIPHATQPSHALLCPRGHSQRQTKNADENARRGLARPQTGKPKSMRSVRLQTSESAVRIEVLYELETFWMSQKRIAELFGVDMPTISEHLQNGYASGELAEEATIRKIRRVQTEGNQKVSRITRARARAVTTQTEGWRSLPTNPTASSRGLCGVGRRLPNIVISGVFLYERQVLLLTLFPVNLVHTFCLCGFQLDLVAYKPAKQSEPCEFDTHLRFFP